MLASEKYSSLFDLFVGVKDKKVIQLTLVVNITDVFS